MLSSILENRYSALFNAADLGVKLTVSTRLQAMRDAFSSIPGVASFLSDKEKNPAAK